MAFERRARWSDAQHEVFRYWASQPKAKSQKVLTKEALERGLKRRRVERIDDSRRVGGEIREVWEGEGKT